MTEAQYAKNLEVGRRIKHIREQNKYTQEEFGPILGLSKNAAAQWESGRALPSIKTTEKISAKFGVSTQWLMAGDHPDELARAQTTAELEALNLLRQTPLSEHQDVLDYLRWRASKAQK